MFFLKMFKSQKTCVSPLLTNDQHDCPDLKVLKNKSKSKTKDFFTKIFTFKSNSSTKSKSSKENCILKTESELCYPVLENGSRKVQNEPMEIVPISSPQSFGSSFNKKDRLKSENNSLHHVDKEKNIRKSEQLVATNEEYKNDAIVDCISEEPLRDVKTLFPYNDIDYVKKECLTISLNEHLRKSSDNNSAVDMKFKDENIDQSEQNADKVKDLKHTTKGTPMKRSDSSTSWRILKAALIWTPFIQHCARHRYPWIQIAGHQGNFKPGDQGTILKKHSSRESICLQMMSEDILSDFIPSFKGDVDYEGEKYICMQDLLAQFTMPSLMDIKMGTRTYLEEELDKAERCHKPRQDMYEKMIEVDKYEPTEEEHRQRGVIKSRYMQWRESLSSTLSLGFRIEGIKKSRSKNNKDVGTQSRNFKRTKYRLEVKESLLDFIDNKANLPGQFIRRIESLRRNLEQSNFFWKHELIGSSLLFVHDRSGKANIWMIDFGKTVPIPPLTKIDHISPWIEGNHEDGYLFGLQNLQILLEEIHSEISIDSS